MAGGSVCLSEGRLYAAATINAVNYTRLYGTSIQGTVIQPATGYTGDLIYDDTVEGFTASDFYLYNGSAYGMHLIDAHNCHFYRIRDSCASGTYFETVVAGETYRNYFESMRFVKNGGTDGLKYDGLFSTFMECVAGGATAALGGYGMFFDGGYGNILINPWIEWCTLQGIYTWSGLSEIIGGTVTSGLDIGIQTANYVAPATLKISGTKIGGNAKQQVYVGYGDESQSHVIVEFCDINPGGVAYDAVYLYKNCAHCQVVGNRFTGTKAGQHDVNVTDASDTYTYIADNTLSQDISDSGTSTTQARNA